MLHYRLQMVLDVRLVFLANDVAQVVSYGVQPLVGRLLQHQNMGNPEQISIYS